MTRVVVIGAIMFLAFFGGVSVGDKVTSKNPSDKWIFAICHALLGAGGCALGMSMSTQKQEGVSGD